MKFNDDIKTRVKDAARDIKDGAVYAYDGKKSEIEQMDLHKNAAAKLTPEEVRRAQGIGLAIGTATLMLILLWVGYNLAKGTGLM